MFFAFFNKQHILTDSYHYAKGPGGFDDINITGEYKRTSIDLKYCNPNKPLFAGFNPDNFMSAVFPSRKAMSFGYLRTNIHEPA